MGKALLSSDNQGKYIRVIGFRASWRGEGSFSLGRAIFMMVSLKMIARRGRVYILGETGINLFIDMKVSSARLKGMVGVSSSGVMGVDMRENSKWGFRVD